MTTNELLHIFARPQVPAPDTDPLPRAHTLNRSHRFQKIAEGIPGWSDLVEAHRVAAGIADTGPRKPESVTVQDAARAILAGENTSAAIDKITSVTAIEARRETYRKVEDAALLEVSDRASAWLAAHLDDIEAALTDQVATLFARAGDAVANLDGVDVPADLAHHPLAAVYWAELPPIANELAQIEQFAANLRPLRVQPHTFDGIVREWPLIGLFDDYPSVWSRYFLTSPLPIQSGQEVLKTLPPARAPWEHSDHTMQIRKLAELRPVARVRLGANYRDYVDAVADRARSDRERLQESQRQEILRERYGH